jgi:serine O-acetyltransferase
MVEDDVIIYSGTTILGRVRIGRGSVIGGNVWLDHDVAPLTTVLQSESSNNIIVCTSASG